MKRGAATRQDLGTIPDVFYDHEPEDTERGTQGAVQTLWDREEQNDAVAPTNQAGLFEDDTEAELPGGPELDELFEIGAEIDEDRLCEALGGGLGERIRKSIEQRGVDALGWYVTFHARGAQWGIYIRSSSVLYLAVVVFGRLTTENETRLRIALRVIHQHELFHFTTDYMSAQWELITGRPCRRPAEALRDRTTGYKLLEEALANANMIRSCQRGRTPLRVRGRADALRAFTELQPAGYRDAYRYASTRTFVEWPRSRTRPHSGGPPPPCRPVASIRQRRRWQPGLRGSCGSTMRTRMFVSIR